MELVTGRKGVAHITSQQDRMKHQGTWGSGAYILQTGQMLEPQVQSSNEIRIPDGALMVQGALGCVKVNTYDPVTIQNGTQGMKRIDLICWQYTYDAEQDVESAEWVVIQGTPAESDPQQPAYTDGDIQQGDSPVQVPVFAVELDGINVTGVTTLLPTAPTLEELNSKISVPITRGEDAPPGVTGTAYYYPAAGIVYANITVPNRNSTDYQEGTAYTLATVPIEYKPVAKISAMPLSVFINGRADGMAAINSAGEIRYIPKGGNTPLNMLIQMSGFWFTG